MDRKLTLEARDVSVARYHRLLVERVSLTIWPSQLVCIMGSSGAGKTTLLTALNGHAQAPPLAQWLTLTARGFAIKAKDRWQTLLLLSQAPIVGLLINSVFGSRLSKAAVAENPLVAVGCGLTDAWPEMLFVLLLVALVGVAIGLFLSAFAKTSEASIAMLPIVLLPMVIFGGALAPLHRLPVPVRALTQTMPSRWGFEAMLLIESESRTPFAHVRRDHESATGLMAATGDWAEDVFPQATCRFGRKTAYLALVATLAMFIVAIERALRAHDRPFCSNKLLSNRTIVESDSLREGGAATPKVSRRSAINAAPRRAHVRGRLCATEIMAFALILAWLCAIYEPTPAMTAPQSKRCTASAFSAEQEQRKVPESDQGLTSSEHCNGTPQGDEPIASQSDKAAEPAEAPAAPPIDSTARRAEKQFIEHDYAGAISTFGWLISSAPTNVNYYAMRARCYEEMGDFQLAEEDAMHAIGLATARPCDHDMLDALTKQVHGIRERNRRSKEQFELGKQKFFNGDYLTAREAFTTVIELKPNSAASYHWRAIAYDRVGRYAEALRDLDAAIKMRQTDASLFYSRSFIHADLREYVAAVGDARTAERLAPARMDYVAHREWLVSELNRRMGL